MSGMAVNGETGTAETCEEVMLRLELELNETYRSVTELTNELATAQEALADSERLLRSLFENLPDTITILDREYRIRDFNHSPTDQDWEEVLDMEASSFVPPERQEALRQMFAQAFETGDKQSHQIEGFRGKWYETHLVPFKGKEQDDQLISISTDITERRKLEAELQQNAKLWKETFDAITDIVSVISIDHEFLNINEAGLRALDLPKGKVIGRKCYELAHQTSEPVKACPCTTSLATGRHGFSELEQNGRTYLVSAWPIIDENGDVSSFVHVTKDITERKRAEEQIKESEERYRKFFEEDLSGDFITTPEGELLDCNTAFCEIYGFASREEALRTNATELYANPTDRQEKLKLLRAEGRLNNYEEEMMRRDGRQIHILSNIIAERDENGELTRLKDYVIDITDRKSAEAQQQLTARVLEMLNRYDEKTDQLKQILLLIKEFTGFDAVALRLKQDEDFPYYVTEGFPATFVEAENYLCTRDQEGQIARDTVGNPVLDCMCRNIIQGRTDPSLDFFTAGGSFWTNSTTELLATTTEAERQSRTRDRGNGEGYESVALIPLRSDNETIGLLQLNDQRRGRLTVEMVEFFEKIGESVGIALTRQLREEQLREALSELKRSNKELLQFAYVASHDLQEPLRMVSSYLQLLARRYKDQLDSDADEFIAFAVDGAKRMQRLIIDLLSFSRVRTHGKPLKPFDAGALLQAAIDNLRIAITEAEASITHDPLPIVHVDDTQLIQLFQNLLENALKFRDEAPPEIHIGAVRRDEDWHFAVRDNGIGINPQYHEKIFAIFQRLQSREDTSGTGIGLSLAKLIVDRHGGRIWVESEVGQGTTFHFTLPVRGSKL